MHHGVKITDEALVDAAVESDRYIADRFLPDKACDVVQMTLTLVYTLLYTLTFTPHLHPEPSRNADPDPTPVPDCNPKSLQHALGSLPRTCPWLGGGMFPIDVRITQVTWPPTFIGAAAY